MGPMSSGTSLRNRIQTGEFENILHFPTDTVLNGDPAYQALNTEQNQLLDRAEEIKEIKAALIRMMKQEYNNESSLRRTQFKAALEEEYGLQNHPKKGKIWQKAWDDGHSGGWTSILNIYDELFDLIT